MDHLSDEEIDLVSDENSRSDSSVSDSSSTDSDMEGDPVCLPEETRIVMEMMLVNM